MILKVLTYLTILAALHAKLELAIEGKKTGWAFNLPCWRIDNYITQLLIGKELTGYHFYLCLMFLLLFHSPVLFLPWTLALECFILGSYFIYWVLEDFSWFIENNYYGLKNFRKGRIAWHKRWFLNLPVSYWISLITGGILLWLGRVAL
jgi:hypothetical protein